ncbi:MAG TPA: hypothetical protein VE782_15810, partial [Myxococcaceae bacterium]|nr:hypothetical protein [Myxococcaceae bacterium]
MPLDEEPLDPEPLDPELPPVLLGLLLDEPLGLDEPPVDDEPPVPLLLPGVDFDAPLLLCPLLLAPPVP